MVVGGDERSEIQRMEESMNVGLRVQLLSGGIGQWLLQFYW